MPKLPRSTSSATSSMASGTIPSRPAKPHPDRLKIMHLFPDRPLPHASTTALQALGLTPISARAKLATLCNPEPLFQSPGLRRSCSHLLTQLCPDQRHENRPKRKAPSPRLLGQAAQVPAGALDRLPSLKDRGHDHRGVLLAQDGSRILPRAGTDPERRPDQARRCHETPPRADAVTRVVADVRTGFENHPQREGPLRSPRLFRANLTGRALAFSKAWIRFCGLWI